MEKNEAINPYVARYGDTLKALTSAAAELAIAGDIAGLRFLIETCDAVLGRALVLIEKQMNAKTAVN